MGFVEQVNEALKAATDKAYESQLAFATGNYREYWLKQGEQAKQRVDEEYEQFRDAQADQEQAEPSDSRGQ